MSWPKGKPRSAETRAKISATTKGRPGISRPISDDHPCRNPSAETKTKMSESAKKRQGPRGPAQSRWKGGNNSRWYRFLAALKLHRPLKEGEIVHHIDGDRTNNSPDNLQVFDSQGDHLRHHKDFA